jgi:hypothetical protein
VAITKCFLEKTEKRKYRAGTIVRQMEAEGFRKFNMQDHAIYQMMGVFAELNVP